MPDAKRGSGLGGMALPFPYLRTCEYWWIFEGIGYKTLDEREEYARILDYLPSGHPDDFRTRYQKKTLVQAIGEDRFVLMELSPKRNKIPGALDRVYIGKGEREVIDRVVKKLRYRELTQGAKKNLPNVLETIVKDGEELFIQFFNKAHPNCFMMLPNVWNVKTWHIKEVREKGEFSSFEDLKTRVKVLRHPEKILAKRIEEEIKGEGSKGYGIKLFVQDPEKIFEELENQVAYSKKVGSEERKNKKKGKKSAKKRKISAEEKAKELDEFKDRVDRGEKLPLKFIRRYKKKLPLTYEKALTYYAKSLAEEIKRYQKRK